jgi:hypothetical protein
MPSTLSKNLNDHSIITQAIRPVEKYSGQKEGEHWNKFFHRQEMKNEGRESHETPQQKQSRLAKEKSANRHHPPGCKGARVFFWEDDQCLGFCVCRATGYDRYQALWSNYNRSQRKYDSFSDEWDICTDFGDAGPDSDDNNFDDDEILEWFQGPSVSTGAPQQGVNSGGIVSAGDINNYGVPVELLPDDPELDHQEGEYLSTVDLIHIHGVYKDGEMPNNAPALNSLEDTAYFQFGFSPIANIKPTEYHVPWGMAALVLGNGHWPNASTNPPLPSQDTQNNMCTFFSHLWISQHVSSIPPQICDIGQHNSDLWASRRNL